MKKYFTTYVAMGLISVLLSFVVAPHSVDATVGGPGFIYEFKYNPINESVYYISTSRSGRGCPPELIRVSLTTGGSDTVYSCDQGERLLANGNYDTSRVYAEINKITSGYKDLSLINLRTNDIAVDIDYVKSEKLSPEIDETIRSIFTATIYQGDKKVTELTLQGCNNEQPFTFAGYAIPGFEKKIVLLLSTKSDCFEGGYIGESLLVLGGLTSVKRDYVNAYKGDFALAPHEGTLVVFEEDEVVGESAAPTSPIVDGDDNGDDRSGVVLPLAMLLALIVGIVIGMSLKKKQTEA